MPCARDINIQIKDKFGKFIVPDIIQKNRCRKSKDVYPSFTPIIDSLSVTNSVVGVYSFVQIKGSNFLPPSNGITYVNFGIYKQLPITFYSSFNIAFVVPLNAIAGNYNVQVVNIYNDNFSPPVNQSYPGIQNYSNSIIYTLL